MTERIVAVESSSAWTSLAIADDGIVRGEAEHEDARGHVEAIGDLFADVIAPILRDGIPVSGVVCGVGPGPYSGLRVGIAYARALALAWDSPVVGVCSLDALAAAHSAEQPGRNPSGYIVTSDARRGEVYWAHYDAVGTRVSGPLVGPISDIPSGPTLVDDHMRARDHVTFLARHDLLTPGAWPVDRLHLALDELDTHGDAGTRTAQALAGRTLLPAQPLYLRGADVTMPARGTWAHPVSAGVRWT